MWPRNSRQGARLSRCMPQGKPSQDLRAGGGGTFTLSNPSAKCPKAGMIIIPSLQMRRQDREYLTPCPNHTVPKGQAGHKLGLGFLGFPPLCTPRPVPLTECPSGRPTGQAQVPCHRPGPPSTVFTMGSKMFIWDTVYRVVSHSRNATSCTNHSFSPRIFADTRNALYFYNGGVKALHTHCFHKALRVLPPADSR